MPRLTKAIPKYRKHRASGQAIVTLNGVDFYLGPHGTKTSKVEYDRLVGEWLESGRHLPTQGSEITVVELAARYWQHAKQHCSKGGKPTGEQPGVKAALKPLRELYGRTPASELGPLALKVIRQRMVDRGNSRKYVNKNIGRIKRMFKWGVENELIPPAVYQSLAAVAGLKRDKTKARDYAPVEPVPEDIVEQTLVHLRPMIADMVQIQRLTSCRPGEVCVMRPADIDRNGDIWAYRPSSHKTEHHGHQRVAFVGPRGQAILGPYLLRVGGGYCFKTRGKPMIPLSERQYRNAIHRACDKGGVERWSPNRLRHSAATEIRKRFGLEAAQVSLGHASADISQIYAERDFDKAGEVMRKIG